MELPKYRFSIGCHVEVDFTEHTGYAASDGRHITYGSDDNLGTYGTDSLVSVSELSRCFFINYNNFDYWWTEGESRTAGHICTYDRDRNYLETIYLDDGTHDNIRGTVIRVSDEVYFITLTLYTVNCPGSVDAITSDFFYKMEDIDPHYSSLKKKTSRESNEIFFRESLEGTIKLYGTSYHVVSDKDVEDRLILLIEKEDENKKLQLYYKGLVNKIACKFDHAAKMCQLGIEKYDEYTKILDRYEDTYDLIRIKTANPPGGILINSRPVTQLYIGGCSSITYLVDHGWIDDDVNEVQDWADEDYGSRDELAKQLYKKYHFAVVGVGSELDITNAPIAGINGIWAAMTTYYATSIPYVGYTTDGKLITDYTISLDWVRNYEKNPYYCIKIRDKNGTVLYHSESIKAYLWNSGDEEKDYFPVADGQVCFDKDKIEFGEGEEGLWVHAFDVTNYFVYQLFGRILCNVDTYSIGEYSGSTYDYPTDDFVADKQNYKKCIPLGLVRIDEIAIDAGLYVDCSSACTTEETEYGMNDYYLYFLNYFKDYYWVPVGRNQWANAGVWFRYNDNYHNLLDTLISRYELKDLFSGHAVIQSLLAEIGAPVHFENSADYSQFLYLAPDPHDSSQYTDKGYPKVGTYTNPGLFGLGLAADAKDPDSPDGEKAGEAAYILGFQDDTERYRSGGSIFIAPKSNILKGDYDQAAQKAEITLKDYLDMFKACFRCYWFIERGRFKMEHVRYFNHGRSYDPNNPQVQLDLTNMFDSHNKKIINYFQKTVEYDDSDLVRKYEFSWMDDQSWLFDGVEIEMQSNYVQQDKTESVTASNFSSDVDLMLALPSNFGEDGFALLIAVDHYGYTSRELPIVSDMPYISQSGDKSEVQYLQNGYASSAFLTGYRQWDLPAWKYSCNIYPIDNPYWTAGEIIKCMTQSITLPLQDDLDMYLAVETGLGAAIDPENPDDLGPGIIEQIEVDLDTRQTEITLRYYPR